MAFSMNVINEEEVAAVIKEEVKPVSKEMQELQKVAEANVEAIMKIDLDAEDGFDQKKQILQSIESFGKETMKTSTTKNELLSVSVGKLSKSGDEGSVVAKSLADLQMQIKDLDPSAIDFAKKGVLGKFFNPLRAYFKRYEKADAVIADIVMSLEKGKARLKNDNVTLELEQENLRKLTKNLQREIELGLLMDSSIERQIEEAKAQGVAEEKIKFIAEEILFPLRQKVQDMQAMSTINYNGILAFEVAMRTNKEIIRGVDRTNTVTISALKNAVTVASTLCNQRIVLNQINALNQTTSKLIEGTSQVLKQQVVETQKQAIETTIPVEVLKKSFEDILEAMNSMNTYKQEALPKMKETIRQFQELATRGEKEVKQIENSKNFDI
jgi:uncharacterized protein YaaN involved in tellurite resistance